MSAASRRVRTSRTRVSALGQRTTGSSAQRSVSTRRPPVARTRAGRRGGPVRRSPARTARGGRTGQSAARDGQAQLRRLGQSSLTAIALTGLMLLVVPEEAPAQAGLRADSLAGQATAEATGALQALWIGFVGVLPKLLVAFLLLGGAWALMQVVRPLVRALSRRTEHGRAVGAVIGIVVWLVAFGSALSVLAGDVRALVGSLGLVGLALSWSLQGPIESVTGWLLNSFKGYYRPGDRIAVGEVQGDVLRIDVLNTTVWEIGGPGSPSGISAEQPTGRLITFPNSEVVAGTVVNYTRDFSFVWDELAVTVAAESDLRYTQKLIERIAAETVGTDMAAPARAYASALAEARLPHTVAERPEVFLRMTDWGADFVVRYLVDVRSRRATKSGLELALAEGMGQEEHASRILGAYPRQQLQAIDASGAPAPWPGR